MSKAASVIAAHVKGGAQRREMGEMQREMQRRLAVEMEELQQLQQSASIWAAAAMTEEKAACAMQAGYRGLVARREVEEERAAQQLAWMQAYRQGRITKLQSLFRGRCARRAAARRGGGGGGGGGAPVPPPEAAQIEWDLESPPGPSEAREPTLAASRGGSLRWELEAEVVGGAAHPGRQHAHESPDRAALQNKAAAAAAAAVAAGVATVAAVGAGNAAWMPTRLDARLARLEELVAQVAAQQQQQHGHSATTAAAVAAAIAPACGGGSAAGGDVTPRRGRQEAEAALEQVRQELTAEREAARAREREQDSRARLAARTPAQVAEGERAALRLQAGARGQAARRGVRELRRALDAPLHGAAAGVRVRDYELANPNQTGHFEAVDFEEGQLEEGHFEVAAACGWAGGWAGGLGHHPALSDVTNAALGLGGGAALEVGAAAATVECAAPRFSEGDEGDEGDEGAPLRSYVPRRHLRATVTAYGAPPPDHGASPSVALLPRLPEGTELPPFGYRSQVLGLQQQQRSLLASLALPQPHAAARLLVQKDFALQALAEQRAEAAVMAAGSNSKPLAPNLFTPQPYSCNPNPNPNPPNPDPDPDH